jgi:hypothetical protein
MVSLLAHQICASGGTISLIAVIMAHRSAHGSEPSRPRAFEDESSLDMVTTTMETRISIPIFTVGAAQDLCAPDCSCHKVPSLEKRVGDKRKLSDAPSQQAA